MGKTISSKFHRMRAEDLKRQVELSKRKAEFKIPPFVVKQFDIDELHEEGRLCYRLVPKQGFNGTYIMYLYSSKLCFRMNPAEWMFLAKTALACHAGIFLPMYPLAPEHCCREVFQMLEPAYANCTKGQDVERVVLMGCGVGGREVGYMFGMYKKLTHEFSGVFTGKGLEFGGSLIRPEATGYGNVYFLMEMLKTKGTDLKGKTVLISGSGNVAQYTAEKVLQLGGKVLTMSDSDGYIYDPDGIDREKLDYIMELKNLYRGRIREYAEKYGCKYVAGARPWGEKADIALPSATQNEINGDQARQLVANGVMAVSEGANMPSTPEAIRVFQEAKILYAPGKAANAGGVSVSGLEMSQNSERLSWTSEEVDARLHAIMENIHQNCVKYGTEADGYVNYVKGANVAGFMKVAKAMMAQGIV